MGAPTAPISNADRDYLVATMEGLRRLENAGTARGDLDRALERRRQRCRALFSTVVSVAAPVFIWVFFLFRSWVGVPDGVVGTLDALAVPAWGLVGATMLLFFVIRVMCNWLWVSHPVTWLRVAVERPARTEYLRQRDALDAQVEEILAEPAFAHPRIPEEMIHPRTVTILLRFFDSGQATFLGAAVYMLRQEVNNNAYYGQIMPTETPAQRESARILADRQEANDHS